jgi:hypothetical protein
MKIISREEAIAKGLKRFFTGVPCIHGHTCERYVKVSTECVECNRLSKQRQRARDPERVRQQWRDWAAREREKINRPPLEMDTA